MSGGSMGYVFEDVRESIDGPISIKDDDKRELVEDIADLLHDIEWSADGDYAPETYRGTLAELTTKWDGGYKNQKTMSKTTEDTNEVTTLEIIQTLQISDEAAKEVANSVDGDIGLIKDHTYGSGYHLVRWNESDSNSKSDGDSR